MSFTQLIRAKKQLRFTIIILYLLLSADVQSVNLHQDEWETYVTNLLTGFLACNADMAGQNGRQYPCNKFLVMAVEKVYGIKDFFDSQGKPLRANQIVEQMRITPETWTRLGVATDQQVLMQAQEYANQKKAIVATKYVSGGIGHVALILPGSLKLSPSWNMQVPNSASFFINRPNMSYVSGPLSKAFVASDKSEVEIWGRNF